MTDIISPNNEYSLITTDQSAGSLAYDEENSVNLEEDIVTLVDVTSLHTEAVRAQAEVAADGPIERRLQDLSQKRKEAIGFLAVIQLKIERLSEHQASEQLKIAEAKQQLENLHIELNSLREQIDELEISGLSGRGEIKRREIDQLRTQEESCLLRETQYRAVRVASNKQLYPLNQQLLSLQAEEQDCQSYLQDVDRSERQLLARTKIIKKGLGHLALAADALSGRDPLDGPLPTFRQAYPISQQFVHDQPVSLSAFPVSLESPSGPTESISLLLPRLSVIDPVAAEVEPQSKTETVSEPLVVTPQISKILPRVKVNFRAGRPRSLPSLNGEQ